MMPMIVPAITAIFEILGRNLVFAEPPSRRVEQGNQGPEPFGSAEQ
jgi:hypothetical protein